jgi:hypothetical protein
MLKRAAQFAIVLALCPAFSFAQGSHNAMTRGQGGSDTIDASPAQANEASALQLLTFVLHLSNSQQAQLRAAFDAALKTAAPITTKLQKDKSSLFEAVRSGKSEDEIKGLAQQEGTLVSQMLLLQAQTFAKLWTTLDSDQKSRVDDFVYGNIRLVLPACPQ